MDCVGCMSFDCAERITIWALGSSTDEEATNWIVSHGLTYGKVSCAKSHEEEKCVVKNDKWRCGNRGCRSVYSVLGPFLGGNKKVKPSRVVAMVYGWVSGLARKLIAKEIGINLKTVTLWIKLLEEMCAYGHMQRYRNAAGTWRSMMKDETAISKIKAGGCGGRRTREKGVQWVHGLVSISRDGKADGVFFPPG